MDRKIKILIVDDENQILETYKSYFIKRGYEVDTSIDGENGLKQLQSIDYDVAIIDIQMPKMDGISLASKIKEEGIDTEVIILTGHGDKDHAVKAINQNVGGWFEKASINMDELLKKVNELAEVISIDEIRRILSTIPKT